jgi:hypothetical protein
VWYAREPIGRSWKTRETSLAFRDWRKKRSDIKTGMTNIPPVRGDEARRYRHITACCAVACRVDSVTPPGFDCDSWRIPPWDCPVRQV